MAEIFTFRSKDDAPSDQDFLTDADQTLSFNTPVDGAVSLGRVSQTSLPTLFPNPKKDWSNQELADLFRVRQLLSGANVPVDTDRGITDEGDPWFVFCHITGDVFIHLCRIDGAYVLDSPNVLRPLRGANFNALIADFTNHALPASGADEDTEHRVIRLERGGKIRLHPSAMLAALIWTLFLASEELVLLAPEEPVDDADTLLNFEGMFAVEGSNDLLEGGVSGEDTLDVVNPLKDTGHEPTHLAGETHGQMREAMLQHQGLTAQQNGFTMGLSTIAIAMGFMSEAVLLGNQRKVLESLKELGFTGYSQDEQDTTGLDIAADSEDGNAILAMLADFLGIELSHDTEVAEAADAASEAALMQQELTHFTDDILTVNEALPSVKAAALLALHDENIDAEMPVDPADRPSKTQDIQDDDILTAETAQDTTVLSLSEAVQVWQQGQTTVKASFDMSDTDVFALFDWSDTASGAHAAKNLEQFDELAQRLIDFFQSKGSDIGFIEQANGFIAVDRGAITGGKVDYIQWETGDGKLIGLIGLQSDFHEFDMIA